MVKKVLYPLLLKGLVEAPNVPAGNLHLLRACVLAVGGLSRPPLSILHHALHAACNGLHHLAVLLAKPVVRHASTIAQLRGATTACTLLARPTVLHSTITAWLSWAAIALALSTKSTIHHVNVTALCAMGTIRRAGGFARWAMGIASVVAILAQGSKASIHYAKSSLSGAELLPLSPMPRSSLACTAM